MDAENHMDAAFRDIWNWLKACLVRKPEPKLDAHRIIHIEDFGYVAQTLDCIGWTAIYADGTTGAYDDRCVGFPSFYACKTEAEAGERINRNEANNSGEIVWKG